MTHPNSTQGSFTGELATDFLKRGFTRRGLYKMATLLAAGAALPFYNEQALAQLSQVKNMPPDAVKINANENPMGPKISVVLNGELVSQANLDLWTEAHKNPDGTPNKFDRPLKNYPRTGYIGLQDHGSPVWYRNIRVKRLDPGR